MALDDCKTLLRKYCGFLADSDVDCADFRFTSVFRRFWDGFFYR
jgi:hypothetical protein